MTPAPAPQDLTTGPALPRRAALLRPPSAPGHPLPLGAYSPACLVLPAPPPRVRGRARVPSTARAWTNPPNGGLQTDHAPWGGLVLVGRRQTPSYFHPNTPSSHTTIYVTKNKELFMDTGQQRIMREEHGNYPSKSQLDGKTRYLTHSLKLCSFQKTPCTKSM